MPTPSAALEALLFASGEPMEKSELARFLGVSERELLAAIDELDKALAGRGLTLIETGRSVELRTAPAAADLVKRLRESQLSRDLGKAGLETLAIVAYKNGSTKSDIDWIRGVNSAASVRSLLLRGLIEGSEDPEDRRKIRYEMTPEALAHLGVAKVSELPRFAALSADTTLAAAAETHE